MHAAHMPLPNQTPATPATDCKHVHYQLVLKYRGCAGRLADQEKNC
jgi:hypothetical protein